MFSFGILLWEICALEVPFDGFDTEKHSRRVVRGNERPKVNKSWPISVQDIMQDAWSENINKRPTFQRICSILRHEVSKFTGKSDENILDRSTNMLDSSVSSRRESMLRATKSDMDF